MKHLFLDTNCLIDFFLDRTPFSDLVAVILQRAKEQKLNIYISAISFNNVYYIVKQTHRHEKTIDLLKTLENLVTIIAVDGDILHAAINSEFKDFEDAIQYYCAASVPEMDVIVTRNLKDYRKSQLPVLHPQEILPDIL